MLRQGKFTEHKDHPRSLEEVCPYKRENEGNKIDENLDEIEKVSSV